MATMKRLLLLIRACVDLATYGLRGLVGV